MTSSQNLARAVVYIDEVIRKPDHYVAADDMVELIELKNKVRELFIRIDDRMLEDGR